MKTHSVFNQVPPFEHTNFFTSDPALTQVMTQNGADWALPRLETYGQLMGEPKWIEKGFLATKHSPVFHSHDRMGNRIDQVEYHPSYHDWMDLGIQHEVHSLPWTHRKPGAHFARLGLFYLHAQNEPGSCCPLTMTFSCVPALQRHFPNANSWLQKITHPAYDPADKPYFEKSGLTIGMAMTEKQGGTDVRANTTKAVHTGTDETGETYELTGHKWFCSAPMCDAFLTLAQTEQGLTCFLLPRWKPDGTKNGFHIQRLKDKLGNRSNASSEVEYHSAFAWRVGEEGRGVPTIIEMVGMTRYDCMIGSAGLMRRGLVEAVHHARHRSVMGKTLIDQPLMQNVLADLALESAAALAMSVRAATCLENPQDPAEQGLLRLLLPVGKYWITKRTTVFLAEAMECLGGNGYVEQSILPRLFREAPVNAIWEGSGNVQCLDLIRAVQKSPNALRSFVQELESAKGIQTVYDNFVDQLTTDLVPAHIQPMNARSLTERMAKAMQAAQLLKGGNSLLADAFCQGRLLNSNGLMFGTLPTNVDCSGIIAAI